MAYKPPKQTIVDNDLQNTPSSEAVFEALKLKIDEPTISGSTGQLLQLDGYVSGEAVVSWVNPPAGYALPSQTGNADKVLVTDGANESWQYAGLGAGSFASGTVVLGRAKPASLTGADNIIIGDNAGNALSNQTKHIAIGTSALSTFNVSAANEPNQSVAIGYESLKVINSASQNWGMVAVGYRAGYAATSGDGAVLIGFSAGNNGTGFGRCVYVGRQAGGGGSVNTGIGMASLRACTGSSNSALGDSSLSNISTGGNNIGIGVNAGNSPTGGATLTTGSSNIIIGEQAGVLTASTSNAIALGRASVAGANEFSVGSNAYQINTVLLGQGGASQTTANAVKIQTMRGTGTDRDMSVGTLTIAGAQGTGTGAGGDVIIATAAPAVSSGSSLNAHVEVMRVTDNGLVGIGTSTPAEKLEVVGAVKADEFTVTRGGGEVYRLDPHTHDEGTETTDFTINWSNGSVHTVTLNAAGPLVITMSNPVDGGAYALRIIQGATPGTVTWPANVKWPGGNPPVLSTNTGDIDVVNLLYYSDTATYYATFALAFA